MWDGAICPRERPLTQNPGPKRSKTQPKGPLKPETSYHIHTSERNQRVKDSHRAVARGDLARVIVLGIDEWRPMVTLLGHLSRSGRLGVDNTQQECQEQDPGHPGQPVNPLAYPGSCFLEISR